MIDINYLHDTAWLMNGRCLSRNYAPKRLMNWQCENNHKFRMTPESVINGNWCPHCIGKPTSSSFLPKTKSQKILDVKYNDIEAMEKCKEVGKWFELELLSTEYVDGNNITWQCKKGHEFDMTIRSLNYRGKYNACPICGTKNRFKK